MSMGKSMGKILDIKQRQTFGPKLQIIILSRVLVPGVPFQSSLILAGKAGAYLTFQLLHTTVDS